MSTKRRRPVQAKRRMSMKNILVMAACLALVAVVSIGGTIAWLTATTDAVTNTFTVGDINITLAETTTDYKMVPGNTIAKDPQVTVQADSEACWLFVKIDQSDNYGTYLEDYPIADGWTKFDSASRVNSAVYYREVDATTAKTGVSYYVLGAKAGYSSGYVTVKEGVTKQQLSAAKTDAPTLTFTAYAVQKDNVASAADAWAKLSTSTTP